MFNSQSTQISIFRGDAVQNPLRTAAGFLNSLYNHLNYLLLQQLIYSGGMQALDRFLGYFADGDLAEEPPEIPQVAGIVVSLENVIDKLQAVRQNVQTVSSLISQLDAHHRGLLRWGAQDPRRARRLCASLHGLRAQAASWLWLKRAHISSLFHRGYRGTRVDTVGQLSAKIADFAARAAGLFGRSARVSSHADEVLAAARECTLFANEQLAAQAASGADQAAFELASARALNQLVQLLARLRDASPLRD